MSEIPAMVAQGAVTENFVIGSTAEEMQRHYDEGNEFFAQWLDVTMSYSCALFAEDDDLETAQRRKLDYHLENIELAPGHRILDIGCGWGGLLERAVVQFGASEAIGITVAKEQAKFIGSKNLPGIKAVAAHWMEYAPDAPFDGLVSIGSFEHFARRGTQSHKKIVGYREFFGRCREWLKPNGCMTLQTIAYGNMTADRQSEFLVNEIFPASELPTLAELAEAARGLFEICHFRNDREHYTETNRRWLKALRKNEANAVRIAGTNTVERYKRYLRMSILGFHLGNVDLLRLKLRRIETPRYP